ncbi:GNAT family N-acetyltransferase [Halobacillus salinarum]|uniref:GNAT family N-acetyltransferase n=1 Tax=Halobacillus salinarum TaxID=2932257 RepID=A0ABY4EJ54_9BACI|nr:GNAT family N-acetyltransferase [Halobacillus salinarum]UOQ44514.1 GNAT family N-acetyltransferase [Halobacillus salinarum]
MEIYLREVKEQDWRSVHNYASLEKVSRYQPWGPNSEEETEAFIQEAVKAALEVPRTRYAYAIMTQGLIGMAGFFDIQTSGTGVSATSEHLKFNRCP